MIDVGAQRWSGLEPFVGSRWRSAEPGCRGLEWRLPEAEVVLLVNLDADRLSWAPSGSDPVWQRVPGIAVAAPFMTSVLLDRSEQRNLVGVQLRPGAALPLFGVPAGALDQPLVALEDLVGPRARTWRDRIARAATGAEIDRSVAGVVREAELERATAGRRDYPEPRPCSP